MKFSFKYYFDYMKYKYCLEVNFQLKYKKKKNKEFFNFNSIKINYIESECINKT